MSLVDDADALAVLHVLLPDFQIGRAWVAREFYQEYTPCARAGLAGASHGIAVSPDPHVAFELRVQRAVGPIRTDDMAACEHPPGKRLNRVIRNPACIAL